MHLIIDSHSRPDQGMLPSPEDSTSTVGYGYAGCRRIPRRAIPVPRPPGSGRAYCIQSIENLKGIKVSSGNRNASTVFGLPINKPPECESRTRGVFMRHTLFLINFLGTSKHEHPPPSRPNANCPLHHECDHPPCTLPGKPASMFDDLFQFMAKLHHLYHHRLPA